MSEGAEMDNSSGAGGSMTDASLLINEENNMTGTIAIKLLTDFEQTYPKPPCKHKRGFHYLMSPLEGNNFAQVDCPDCGDSFSVYYAEDEAGCPNPCGPNNH